MSYRGGMPGNRGNEQPGTTFLKIRSYTTARGKPLAQITIPIEVMQRFGWMPGMYLLAYPTAGKELVLVEQGQAVHHVSPDYDLAFSPTGRPMPPPRPGSVDELVEDIDSQYESAIGQLMGRGRQDEPDKPTASERLERSVERMRERDRVRARKQEQEEQPAQEQDRGRAPRKAPARRAPSRARRR